MEDTSFEIKTKYHSLLMKKSGEERFLMGLSMCDTVRRIVESSIPKSIPIAEKRGKIFIRYYGNDFSETQKKEIIKFLNRNY